VVLISKLYAAPINGTVNAQEALCRGWGQRLLGRAGSCVLHRSFMPSMVLFEITKGTGTMKGEVESGDTRVITT